MIIADPENVDDLFAYDAGNTAAAPSESTHSQVGPSTAPEGYHPNQLNVGATLAQLAESDMDYVKSETPEVKAEEEEYLYYEPL